MSNKFHTGLSEDGFYFLIWFAEKPPPTQKNSLGLYYTLKPFGYIDKKKAEKMSVNYAKSTKTRKKYLIVSENSSRDILFIWENYTCC